MSVCDPAGCSGARMRAPEIPSCQIWYLLAGLQESANLGCPFKALGDPRGSFKRPTVAHFAAHVLPVKTQRSQSQPLVQAAGLTRCWGRRPFDASTIDCNAVVAMSSKHSSVQHRACGVMMVFGIMTSGLSGSIGSTPVTARPDPGHFLRPTALISRVP